MELVNAMYSVDLDPDQTDLGAVRSFGIENIVLLLSPIVPHFSEELWSILGHGPSIVDQPWPAFQKDALVTDEILIVVQVNGKLRSKFTVDAGVSDDFIREAALGDEQVGKHISGKTIKKVIVVKKKLVNIVV